MANQGIAVWGGSRRFNRKANGLRVAVAGATLPGPPTRGPLGLRLNEWTRFARPALRASLEFTHQPAGPVAPRSLPHSTVLRHVREPFAVDAVPADHPPPPSTYVASDSHFTPSQTPPLPPLHRGLDYARPFGGCQRIAGRPFFWVAIFSFSTPPSPSPPGPAAGATPFQLPALLIICI